MGRIAVFLALAVAFFGATAEAQEYPAGEIFGGFSIYDSGPSNLYGWQASGAANLSEHLGIVGDFGGQYRDFGNIHQVLFGPRLRTSRSRWSGFAHTLLGFQRANSSSNFTMGFGGGLDVTMENGWGVRAIQFDWLPTRSSDQWFNDQFRLGFGLVVPIGNN